MLAGVENVRLSIEPAGEKGGGYVLRIHNGGSAPISYFGYGGEGSLQPAFGLEVKAGLKWVERFLGWCGNGMGPCQIEGQKSVKVPFFYGFPMGKESIHFKVSISASAQDAAHWDHKSAVSVSSPIYAWTNGRIEQVRDDQPSAGPDSKVDAQAKPKAESKGRSQ